jgi:hypothetical protein
MDGLMLACAAAGLGWFRAAGAGKQLLLAWPDCWKLCAICVKLAGKLVMQVSQQPHT